jgi:hypothetical protein
MKKTCSNCKNTKNVTDFHKRGNLYRSHCKECRKKRENESSKKRMRKFRKENIDHVRRQQREWIKKPEVKKKRNKKQKEKRRRDPQYRIRHNLRCRLNKALKGISKADTTLNLLGCNQETLIKHLESQFTDGMNWDNYGQWHIDHVLPCSSFDLTKKEDQRKCFHYTNLQPLWAEENIRKSDS